MKRIGRDGQADFPIREESDDFSGKRRTFVITCYEAGLGHVVRASEEGTEGNGDELAAKVLRPLPTSDPMGV